MNSQPLQTTSAAWISDGSDAWQGARSASSPPAARGSACTTPEKRSIVEACRSLALETPQRCACSSWVAILPGTSTTSHAGWSFWRWPLRTIASTRSGTCYPPFLRTCITGMRSTLPAASGAARSAAPTSRGVVAPPPRGSRPFCRYRHVGTVDQRRRSARVHGPARHTRRRRVQSARPARSPH
eukprot:scaffold7407_cov131-Isochrysis_galbana.AAC.2